MKEEIQEYIDKIWRVDRQSIEPGVFGMAAYGTRRFDAQRDYYVSLPLEEKRKYEDAVIALCRMKDVTKTTFGIYICSQLADVFPVGWKDRVIALVYSLIDAGLPIEGEENAIGWDVYLPLW